MKKKENLLNKSFSNQLTNINGWDSTLIIIINVKPSCSSWFKGF